MSRNVIMTITSSTPAYQAYSELTHPLIRKYAHKCHADFICVRKSEYEDIAWEKIATPHKLFKWGYDRVLHIDTDMLVRPDTPDLFKLYPDSEFVCLNENKFMENNPACIDTNGYTIHANWYKSYAENYHGIEYQPAYTLNTGLFLFDKNAVDKIPLTTTTPKHAHYEQPYLTMILQKNNVKYSDHPLEFNHIDNSAEFADKLSKSYIPHFSGNSHHNLYNSNIERMKKVLEIWKAEGFKV